MAARKAAFKAEAADERKLREKLGALPSTAEGQLGAGKPGKSRGKATVSSRKRKALVEVSAAGISHTSKRNRAAEGQKKG